MTRGPLGASHLRYRAEPPRSDAQGLWLVWRAAAPPPTEAQVLVERHTSHAGEGGHAGEDGPACGARVIVGRVRAQPELTWRLAREERGTTYRLLDTTGAPLSEAIVTPRRRLR